KVVPWYWDMVAGLPNSAEGASWGLARLTPAIPPEAGWATLWRAIPKGWAERSLGIATSRGRKGATPPVSPSFIGSSRIRDYGFYRLYRTIRFCGSKGICRLHDKKPEFLQEFVSFLTNGDVPKRHNPRGWPGWGKYSASLRGGKPASNRILS